LDLQAWYSVLTGNPTVTLRRAILFVPAWRSMAPLNVQLLCSLVPKADPVKETSLTQNHSIRKVAICKQRNCTFNYNRKKPENCPLTNT